MGFFSLGIIINGHNPVMRNQGTTTEREREREREKPELTSLDQKDARFLDFGPMTTEASFLEIIEKNGLSLAHRTFYGSPICKIKNKIK
jgi:hypothetical protein